MPLVPSYSFCPHYFCVCLILVSWASLWPSAHPLDSSLGNFVPTDSSIDVIWRMCAAIRTWMETLSFQSAFQSLHFVCDCFPMEISPCPFSPIESCGDASPLLSVDYLQRPHYCCRVEADSSSLPENRGYLGRHFFLCLWLIMSYLLSVIADGWGWASFLELALGWIIRIEKVLIIFHLFIISPR